MRKKNIKKFESLWPDLAIGLTGLAVASLLGLLCSSCSVREEESGSLFVIVLLLAGWLALVPVFAEIFAELVDDLIEDGSLPKRWEDYTNTLGIFWPFGVVIFIVIMLKEEWV